MMRLRFHSSPVGGGGVRQRRTAEGADAHQALCTYPLSQPRFAADSSPNGGAISKIHETL